MHLNSVRVYLFPGTYLKVQTVRGALKHRFPNFSCASFLLCAAVIGRTPPSYGLGVKLMAV